MRYRKPEELKETDVEGLEKLPSSWRELKFKYAVDLISDNSEEVDFSVALENIESWTGNLIETDSNYNSNGTLFKKGDVLFGKLRPYLAKVFLAKQEGKAFGDIYVFRGKALKSDLLFYLTASHNFIDIVDSSTYGAKMPRANWDFIGNLKIPFPPKSEQRSIAAFLDRKTEAIDQLIQKKKQLIDRLKEKRQALITQAVTKGLEENMPMKDSGVEWLGEIPEHWDTKKLKYIKKAKEELFCRWSLRKQFEK